MDWVCSRGEGTRELSKDTTIAGGKHSVYQGTCELSSRIDIENSAKAT